MKDYTRIYLVRHGHLINSDKGVFNGHSDIGLSLKGVAQTITVSQWFKDKPIRAIYSSDLRRSQEGAKTIASSLGLEVISTEAFRERNFGRFEGLTPDEIQRDYGPIWERWIADPIDTTPPDGESFFEMEKRIMEGLEAMLDKHRNEEIMIYSHGGVNRIILCHALNLNIENWFRLQQDFCGISIVDFYNSTALVRLMNWSPQNYMFSRYTSPAS